MFNKERPMIRRVPSFSLAVLLSVSAVVACDKAGEAEQKKEATATAQAVEATAQAQQNAQSARLQANTDIAAARADFEKTREDYRRSRQQDLLDVNKKITDLEAKEMTATGRAKINLDTNLPLLRAKRDAFTRDLQAVDSTTPGSWDGTRASLDKEWGALKDAVAQAS
jgi:septal ring factor EnvC (AmiA/AmiB activator)